MAILKDVENEFGIEFHYHKLRDIRVTNDDKGVILVLTVYSWVNKQARIDGKQPCIRQCIISGADFAMNSFYALLKAKFPEFKNGENDFDNEFKGGNVPAHPEFFDQTEQGKLFNSWRESTVIENIPQPAESDKAEKDEIKEPADNEPDVNAGLTDDSENEPEENNNEGDMR